MSPLAVERVVLSASSLWGGAMLGVKLPPPEPPLALTPKLVASYAASLYKSLTARLSVLKRFNAASAVLAIAAPVSSVWPPTSMSNPPAPAWMPVCSLTLV